jgi:hypothetical protein
MMAGTYWIATGVHLLCWRTDRNPETYGDGYGWLFLGVILTLAGLCWLLENAPRTPEDDLRESEKDNRALLDSLERWERRKKKKRWFHKDRGETLSELEAGRVPQKNRKGGQRE